MTKAWFIKGSVFPNGPPNKSLHASAQAAFNSAECLVEADCARQVGVKSKVVCWWWVFHDQSHWLARSRRAPRELERYTASLLSVVIKKDRQ